MIVQSDGLLQKVIPPGVPPAFDWAYRNALEINRPARYHTYLSDYFAGVYATQPNIRIPIDFMASQVAQLGIHIYRRVSDTDRERLIDHPLAKWLDKPNPATCTYRLIEALLADLGVYKNAYWLKVRYRDGNTPAIGLVRLPPEQMFAQGGLLPSGYVWRSLTGQELEFEPSELVVFGGYNPLDPLMGLSHMATLDRVIREDLAASAHREFYWRNASRHEGVIERPATAPKWTPAQKHGFREQWQQRFSGSGNAGLIAVLEDGMSFKPAAFSPRDSEFIQGGKLRREVTAAEFNVPQPSIGILDHATFSNIREQHKQLYQDSLGPTLEMIEQEIERQLLIECADQKGVYVEFNIAAKLAGSFDEQAQSLRLLVGRPIMTANEGRAKLNLPSIKDDPTADQLAAQQGGPAIPAPPVTVVEDDGGDDTEVDPEVDMEPSDDLSLVQMTIAHTRERQRSHLGKYTPDERSSVFFAAIGRWNRELAHDLEPLVGFEEAVRLAEQANAELFLALDAQEANRERV